MPEYPQESDLRRGITVEIEQTDTGDELIGEVKEVLGEADGPGAKVELQSGVVGRALRIEPDE